MEKVWDNPGPDAGYSWIVCFSCFFINHFAGGFRNVQGNLYVVFQRTYGVERETASWPNTCHALTVSFSALFSGMMNYYFGWRKVLNSLAAIGTLGFILAFLGPANIIMTCVYEILIGFSIGPVFPTLVKVSAAYFVKRRGIAQNIIFGANSVSSIVFPLIFDRVESFYGLRGSWLILCGLYIQTFIFVALICPPTNNIFSKHFDKEKNLNLLANEVCLNSNGKSINEDEIDTNRPTERLKDINVSNRDKTSKNNNEIFIPNIEKVDFRRMEEIDLTPSIQMQKKYVSILPELPIKPKPVTCGNYFHQLSELLTDPIFIVYLFTVTVDFTLFMSSFFVVIDHGIDIGLTATNATMLLIAISVGDFISRLFAGWFIDKQYMTLLNLFAVSCFLSGLVYIFIGLSSTPTTLFIGCFLNGLVYCFTSALRILMATNLFHEEKAATITGLIMFLLGCFMTLSPMFIGIFRDRLGSYSYLYFFFGCLDVSLVPVALLLNNAIKNRNS